MLRISYAQILAFSTERRAEFVASTVIHLEAHFSRELSRHGITDTTHLVERGVVEAESFGITGTKDVRLYIECMVMLKPDFATAPRFPWARATLRADTWSSTQKMNRLHDHVLFAAIAP